MGRRLVMVVLVLCVMAVGPSLLAQEAAPKECAWHYELSLFLWGSGLSGTAGPAANQLQVTESFSGLVGYLDMAFMGHFQASSGKWSILFDPYYVDLGDDTVLGDGSPAHIDMKDTILNLAGGYRLYQGAKTSFDLTFGMRYNELRTVITSDIYPSQHKTINWLDPVMGFKGGVELGKTWSFGYRADVGGFGFGSRLTWSGDVLFNVKLSKVCSLSMGYLYYDVDYTEGGGPSDPEAFVYDMAQAGPVLGVTFRW